MSRRRTRGTSRPRTARPASSHPHRRGGDHDATVPDATMLEPIHAALADRHLLPGEHYLDSGYPSAAEVLRSARRWGMTLVSPLLADSSPQARAGAGYDRAHFTIDFDKKQASCPQEQTSARWHPVTQRGTAAVVIQFAAGTCRPCPVRDRCTRSTSPRPDFRRPWADAGLLTDVAAG